MRQELLAGRLTPVQTSHHTTSSADGVIKGLVATLSFDISVTLSGATLVLGGGTGSPAAL